MARCPNVRIRWKVGVGMGRQKRVQEESVEMPPEVYRENITRH